MKTAADVCNLPQKLIILGSDATTRLVGLEKFLLESLYCHDTLLQANKKIEKWLTSLFDKLCGNIELMPRYFQRMVPSEGLRRTVCDYIAGTTDRYCLSLIQ